jgi:hypothetical protein
MSTTEKQVALTVMFRGAQVSRGRYSFISAKTAEGTIPGVVIEQRPLFSQVTKQLALKEQFVQGALEEAPKSMKMKPIVWRTIPEDKRIGIHVKHLVRDLYPENVAYVYEII